MTHMTCFADMARGEYQRAALHHGISAKGAACLERSALLHFLLRQHGTEGSRFLADRCARLLVRDDYDLFLPRFREVLDTLEPPWPWEAQRDLLRIARARDALAKGEEWCDVCHDYVAPSAEHREDRCFRCAGAFHERDVHDGLCAACRTDYLKEVAGV